jgi:hypothetical protein
MSVMIRAALTTVALTAVMVAGGGVVASANTGSASGASSAAAWSANPFKDCRFATSSGTAIVNVTATAMVSTYSSIQHRTVKVRRTVTLKRSVKVSVPSIICVGTHKSSVKVYVLIGG